MKVVVVSYGGRGDIEPCAAVGRELSRRGHEVCVAVPPNLTGLVESAGLVAVGYGSDTQSQMDAATDFLGSAQTRDRLEISKPPSG